jgi:D-alanine-D-alanine ligase
VIHLSTDLENEPLNSLLMTFTQQSNQYKVWIFAPYLESDDPVIQSYYDYTQSIDEFTRVFSQLNCEWEWVNITINNYKEQIARVKSSKAKQNIVLNLCDGDEINQVPGVSVIHALKAENVIFTGSEAHFYQVTTSKIPMKEAFDQHGVSTPRWKKLNGQNRGVIEKVGGTIIVKPAVSAGSMGIGIDNVVSDYDALKDVLAKIRKGYRGWKLYEAGVLAEQFIEGREFTVLLVGSHTHPEAIKMYTPIERVFHKSLPETEKFLSFDRLWANYNEEAPMPNDEDLYQYEKVTDAALIERINKLSIEAYKSVQGTGYTRLDIRMDKNSGELYVLEVNAQCGLSEDENYTSIGAILRFSGKSFTDLTVEILDDALLRHSA